MSGHNHHDFAGERLIAAAREALVASGEQWTEMRADVFEALAGHERPASAYDSPKRWARGAASAGAANPVGDPLFDALRATRRELAAEANVPPYVIFHDAVLRAMATERPATLDAMATIPGVGAKKLEAWGDAFLAVIRQF